jgi:hypothetical protein
MPERRRPLAPRDRRRIFTGRDRTNSTTLRTILKNVAIITGFFVSALTAYVEGSKDTQGDKDVRDRAIKAEAAYKQGEEQKKYDYVVAQLESKLKELRCSPEKK